MFLTKESWRTNNPVVQAIASPYTSWDAVILGLTQATFMVKVSQQETNDFRDTNWLLLARLEALLQLMNSSEVEVGDVMVLLPPRDPIGGQWICERMITLMEKSDQYGTLYEYATEERTVCSRAVQGSCKVTFSYSWKDSAWLALAQ